MAVMVMQLTGILDYWLKEHLKLKDLFLSF